MAIITRAILVLVFAVGTTQVVSERDAPAQGFVVEQCTRLAGKDIGALPLDIELAGQTVHFTGWTMIEEEGTNVVGFTARVPEGVSFVVQSGDETFAANTSRWLHPRFAEGSTRGVGVDAITFCVWFPQNTVQMANLN